MNEMSYEEAKALLNSLPITCVLRIRPSIGQIMVEDVLEDGIKHDFICSQLANEIVQAELDKRVEKVANAEWNKHE